MGSGEVDKGVRFSPKHLPGAPIEPVIEDEMLQEFELLVGRAIPTFQGGKSKLALRMTDIIQRMWTREHRDAITVMNDYFGGSGGWGVFLSSEDNFDHVKELNVYEWLPDRVLKIRLFHDHGSDFNALWRSSGVESEFDKAAKMLFANGESSSSKLAEIFKTVKAMKGDPLWRGMCQAVIDFGTASPDSTDDFDPITARIMIASQACYLAEAVAGLRKRGVKVTVHAPSDSYTLSPLIGKHVLAVFDPPYYNMAGYGEDGDKPRNDIVFYRKNVAMLEKLVAADNNIIYSDNTWWTPQNLSHQSGERAKQDIERPEAMQLLKKVQNLFAHLDIWPKPVDWGRYETIGIRNALETA